MTQSLGKAPVQKIFVDASKFGTACLCVKSRYLVFRVDVFNYNYSRSDLCISSRLCAAITITIPHTTKTSPGCLWSRYSKVITARYLLLYQNEICSEKEKSGLFQIYASIRTYLAFCSGGTLPSLHVISTAVLPRDDDSLPGQC